MTEHLLTSPPDCFMPSAYCLLAFAVPDVGQFMIKVLAIFGGVAAGALACGLFLQLAARFVLRLKKVPGPVLATTRVLGGIAVGLLVWAWVFSPGGEGGMGGSGGGWWPFGQAGGKGDAVATRPAAQEVTPKKTEPAAEPPRSAGEALRVTMLGGPRVRDQRFYVLGEDPPRNWDELRQAIADRKQQNPALGQIDVVIYRNSVDRDNPAVTELTRWAQENGLTPRVSFLDQNLP